MCYISIHYEAKEESKKFELSRDAIGLAKLMKKRRVDLTQRA